MMLICILEFGFDDNRSVANDENLRAHLQFLFSIFQINNMESVYSLFSVIIIDSFYY